MPTLTFTYDELLQENNDLRAKLAEAEKELQAIHSHEATHKTNLTSSFTSNSITPIFPKKIEDQIHYQAKLLETVRDPIISIDLDYTIISWNKAAEDLYGWSAEEVVGKKYADIHIPTYPFDTRENVMREFTQTGKWVGDAIFTTRKGKPIHIFASVILIQDENSKPIGIVGIHRDIRERIKIEKDLQALVHLAQSTVDALSANIAILDENGVIISVNQAWRNYSQENGIKPNYVWEGLNYLSVCENAEPDNYDAIAICKGIQDVINGQLTEFDYEYPCHTPTELRWFLVRVNPFSNNRPTQVVVAHENVTEKKLAEQALLKTNSQLLVLNRIIALTHATLDTEIVLDNVCRELTGVFNSPQVIVALIDEAELFLQSAAEHRISPMIPPAHLKIPLENNLLFDYLKRYQIPLSIYDVQHDIRLEAIRGQGVRSLLLVPLFVRQKLLGTIAIIKAEFYEFSGEEITLSAMLAQAVSQSLENTLLHKSITEQNNNLEQLVHTRTAQLQRLNERMATILDHTGDAILLVETHGIIQNTNVAFDQIFGYEHDDMFQRHLEQLIHPDHLIKVQGILQKCTQSQQAQEIQVVGIRKDGSTFDMDCTLAYVHDNGGHIVVTLRDITHLKEVERMKDHFVSMVSHELKNPLASMMLSANNLKHYYARMDDEKRMAVIDRLNNGTQQMAELIEGILDLARLNTGTQARTEEPIEMQHIVEKVIAELLPTSEAKRQTIVLKTDLDASIVSGDSLDFTRIWRNLISNAIKYTPDKGKIVIRLGTLSLQTQSSPILSAGIAFESLVLPIDMPDGDYLLCQIEDDGYGISAKDLERLFTRFFRGSAAKKNIAGTGLGLALVRELLQFYNGDICVVSELNGGSCFSFWLKL